MKTIKDICIKNLGAIYKTSKDICDDWDKKAIPLITIYEIIKRSKPKKTGNKEVDNLIKLYNNTLDSLYEGLKDIADRMESNSVPLSELVKGIDIIKANL